MRRDAARRKPFDQVLGAGQSAACEGKRSYPDREKAAKQAKSTRRHTHHRLDAYRCPHCAQWHVGAADIRKKKP